MTKTTVKPDDLSQFAPSGESFYGYGKSQTNPFSAAPPTEKVGGVIYFGNSLTETDFATLLQIMYVQGKRPNPRKDSHYVKYDKASSQPLRDGYLRQLRIVSTFALRYMFNTLTEFQYESIEPQEQTMSEALWQFMEEERERWGTSFTQDSQNGLAGLFGGDGNYAREELCFGFMVENSYNGIYRIWSRAWLVTK